MTLIAELQEQLDKKRAEAFDIRVKIDKLVGYIRELGCDHSVTEDYRWEWDNGYGQQKMIGGRRCIYCGFIDLWGRKRFVDPKDIG